MIDPGWRGGRCAIASAFGWSRPLRRVKLVPVAQPQLVAQVPRIGAGPEVVVPALEVARVRHPRGAGGLLDDVRKALADRDDGPTAALTEVEALRLATVR